MIYEHLSAGTAATAATTSVTTSTSTLTREHHSFPGYEREPDVEKRIWSQLEQEITLRENQPPSLIDAKECYTLRLDIRAMSKTKRKLLRLKIFEEAFSLAFVDIMKHVAQVLA